jgi:Rrf2 family protein
MKLSTRSRYGLRALIELAARHGGGPINMQDIADHEQVSRKYLDTLFASLKVAGLVASRRGLGGGWILTRSPEAIRLGEVMLALEGSMALVSCTERPDSCVRSPACVAHELYNELDEALAEVLQRYTLADMVGRRAQLEQVLEQLPQGADLCHPRGEGTSSPDR